MWVVYALLAAISAAIVVTLSKAGLKNVDSNLGFAIQSVMILIVSWSVIAWNGKFSDLGKVESNAWLYLIAAGIITCLSSLFTFAALKMGDASRVSPLDKISLVFSIALAALFLKEKVTWQTMMGAGLMAVGAVVIALAGSTSQNTQ
jgi:transporter family protein